MRQIMTTTIFLAAALLFATPLHADQAGIGSNPGKEGTKDRGQESTENVSASSTDASASTDWLDELAALAFPQDGD